MDLTTLEKGDLISISNGDKEPPKHHSKKHAAWKTRNKDCYFSELETEYNNILVSDSPPPKVINGVPQRMQFINVISMNGLTITKK